MILTIFKELKELCDGGILGICLLEKLEEVSRQLWHCACLTKLCNFLVLWYNINVSEKPTEHVSDNVGFARLILHSKVVFLNGKDPTYNTICC